MSQKKIGWLETAVKTDILGKKTSSLECICICWMAKCLFFLNIYSNFVVLSCFIAHHYFINIGHIFSFLINSLYKVSDKFCK